MNGNAQLALQDKPDYNYDYNYNNFRINSTNFSVNDNDYDEKNPTVIEVNSQQQFDEILKKNSDNNRIIIFNFYAMWYGPCKMIEGEYVKLSKFYKPYDTLFLKVDSDKQQALSTAQNVLIMPTFHLYKNGKLLEKFNGADMEKLRVLLEKHIAVPIILKNIPYKYIPMKKKPLWYTDLGFDEVKVGFAEINKGYNDEKKNKMTDQEVKHLTTIIEMLQDEIPNKKAHFKFDNAFLNNVIKDKLIKQWRSNDLLIIIDFVKILVLHPNLDHYMQENNNRDNLIYCLLEACFKTNVGNSDTYMYICNVISNMFQRPTTASYAIKYLGDILTYLNPSLYLGLDVRYALVQMLSHFVDYIYEDDVNYALKQGQNFKNTFRYTKEKLRLLVMFAEHLSFEKELSPAYANIIALGTLLFRDINIINFGNTMELTVLIETIKYRFDTNRDVILNCEEILTCIDKPES